MVQASFVFDFILGYAETPRYPPNRTSLWRPWHQTLGTGTWLVEGKHTNSIRKQVGAYIWVLGPRGPVADKFGSLFTQIHWPHEDHHIYHHLYHHVRPCLSPSSPSLSIPSVLPSSAKSRCSNRCSAAAWCPRLKTAGSSRFSREIISNAMITVAPLVPRELRKITKSPCLFILTWTGFTFENLRGSSRQL